VPVVWFAYPETMGRSLEELEMMFAEGKSIRGIVKESRKPLTVGLGLGMADKKKGDAGSVEEDEFA
jgi:hypothetical protein